MTVFAMVAGEPSGDLLGAGLVRQIKSSQPDARCLGIGGPRMIAEGFESLYPMETLSVMGLVEVLGRLGKLLSIRRALARQIVDSGADVFIGIDAPDFNLSLEQTVKKQGIPTVHYVGPQVWAWRSGRLKKIKRSVDHMLVLFPFEQACYQEYNIPVTFVGHPLADEIPLEPDVAAARQLLGLNSAEEGPVIGLLPGSRKAEVANHGPLLLETAARLASQWPKAKWLTVCANEERKAQYLEQLRSFPDLDIAVSVGNSREVMTASDALLVTSGTATLEAALCKKPMVVCYRANALTVAIMRKMAKISHVALPNLLSEEPCIPEYLQEKATADNLALALKQAVGDSDWRDRAIGQFAKMHQQLRRDSSQTAYRAVMSVVGREHE